MRAKNTVMTLASGVAFGAISKFFPRGEYAAASAVAISLFMPKESTTNNTFLFLVVWLITYTLALQL